MPFVLRIAALAATLVAGFSGILLTLWPAWAKALAAGGSFLPWRSGAWSLMLVNQYGQASEAAHQPAVLAILVMLTLLTLLSSGAGLVLAPASAKPIAVRPEEVDRGICEEMGRVIGLVRTHLEANGLHAASLAKANAQLPSLTKPEQVRVLISYLMVENENMRGKAGELQANLETSRKQIENLKSNLAEAQAQGLRDALTELDNRRGFDASLAGAMAEAARGGQPLSLVLADIDRFKTINDRYGHQAGDDVLKWFAKTLTSNVKGRDTVARYGGEEFAIVLPQTGLEGATRIAAQIKSQIEQRNWILAGSTGGGFRLTASFGVAEVRTGESPDQLVKRADARLYEAKSAGRNRVAA